MAKEGDKTEFSFIDPATDKFGRRFTVPGRVTNNFLLSPDSQKLVFWDKEFTLCDATNGKILGTLTPKGKLDKVLSYRSPIFSKDGAKLFCYAHDQTKSGNKIPDGGYVMEWDVASCKLLRMHVTAHDPGRPNSTSTNVPAADRISLSSDENTLVLNGIGPTFFDLTAGKEIERIKYDNVPPMEDIQFLPDGESLLTGWGLSLPLKKWATATGKNVGSVSNPIRLEGNPALGRAVSSDAKVVASVHQIYEPSESKKQSSLKSIEVLLVETTTGSEIGRIKLTPTIDRSTSRSILPLLRFAPDGKMLAICQLDKVELYRVPGAERLHTLAMRGFPQTMIFSPDGAMLASFDDSYTPSLWDTTTGKRIGLLPADYHQNPEPEGRHPVIGGAFSPDGRCLVMQMNDGTAIVYELASRQPRFTVGTKQMKKRIPFDSQVAFSPDGKLLVQAGGDKLVNLWDMQTGREAATFKGHAEAVNAVAFSPDGKTVASASSDSTALIWDVSKLKRPAIAIKVLQPDEIAIHWQTLTDTDAAKAFDAISALTAAPTQSAAFLKEKLKPARPEEPKTSGFFLHGDALRAHRAVEVLERIGTPAARQLLQVLADGAPGARLTISAQAALKR